MGCSIMAGIAIHLDQITAFYISNLEIGLHIHIFLGAAIRQRNPDIWNGLPVDIGGNKINGVLDMPVDSISQSLPHGTAPSLQQ